MVEKVEKSAEIAFALTLEERRKCIEKIIKKNKRILYVFEQSLSPKSLYDYKAYVKSVAIFTETSNSVLNGCLTEIVINLYSIILNDFSKEEIKKIVHENTNLLTSLQEEVEV